MTKLFTSQQFVDKFKWLVNDVPNEYYSGSQWLTYDKATGKFRMDCVLSVKGILWNFSGDKNKTRGGAIYKANGVPDFTCNGALNYCTDVSTDFSKIVPGEYVCMVGTKYNHTGICMKSATATERGKMFECTTGWETRKCIISEFDIKGNRYYNGVKNVASWTKHGKLQWIDYGSTPPKPEPVNQVKLWQETMNKQWNCGLAVDGSFGPISTSEAKKHQLYYLVKAPIMVKWLQKRLIDLGYSCGTAGIDGSFGDDTNKAVRKFQKDKGLKVDGYVGPNTYKALTK